LDRFLADALRSTSLFSDLSDRQLSRLAGASTLRRYPKDSEIFTGGQEARAFYLVLSGAVKVYLLSSEGREQILHILGPGDLVAEAAVFGGSIYPASAMATEDSRLLGIQRDRLLELIREDPELALSMIGGLVQRLREFVVTIEDLALRDVAARLARYLLENSRDGVCVLPGTKTQLAARLGTVLEPLSRAFRKLRQEDLIQDRGGTVRILDEDGLRDLVEGI